MSTDVIGRAQADRWRTCAEILGEVRRRPGLTRVELVRHLGLSSASATETLARLRPTRWIAEHRAPATGRGRPTTVLAPDPDGPRVAAVDLRHEDWRIALAGLDGEPEIVASGRHPHTRDPDAVLDVLRSAMASVTADAASVPAVGVSAPAAVVGGGFGQAPGLGWGAFDVADLGAGRPVVLGNDATLAGVAEVRTGAAVGAATALHLIVEVGVGGALVLDGVPQVGRDGAAGEYGHLPFGSPERPCPCGARGCWDLEVDGRALARRLGEPEPADGRSYAEAVLDRARAGDPAARQAVDGVAEALGRGVAGLVNAHDPDVVVVGGLGVGLRAVGGTFERAYREGLMAFRRASPCPVLDPVHGDDAPLHGAVALALDRATSPEGLARAAE